VAISERFHLEPQASQRARTVLKVFSIVIYNHRPSARNKKPRRSGLLFNKRIHTGSSASVRASPGNSSALAPFLRLTFL
jgi:hypothetical protein